MFYLDFAPEKASKAQSLAQGKGASRVWLALRRKHKARAWAVEDTIPSDDFMTSKAGPDPNRIKLHMARLADEVHAKLTAVVDEYALQPLWKPGAEAKVIA